MSTLVFEVLLNDEPDEEEDLRRMQVTRAIISSITGIAEHALPGGLHNKGGLRVASFSAHAECIPHRWIRDASWLKNQGFISHFNWSGNLIEEKKVQEVPSSMTIELDYENIRYRGVLYQIKEET
jgi:hypothetical protein